MYRAKEMGKSRCEVFDDSMRERAMERLELESGLRHALDGGELRLVYQPLVTLDDGRIGGVEALLRWDHPIFGMVAPLRFIALAERNGLIIPIGAWVLARHAASSPPGATRRSACRSTSRPASSGRPTSSTSSAPPWRTPASSMAGCAWRSPRRP
jgi:predicted signal transduction protein with EAL and GGDEF domain